MNLVNTFIFMVLFPWLCVAFFTIAVCQVMLLRIERERQRRERELRERYPR